MGASRNTEDVTVVALALLLSLMPLDLFPRPTALLALLICGVGVVAVRRGRAVGRRLLAAFAGMLLAEAALAVLAISLH